MCDVAGKLEQIVDDLMSEEVVPVRERSWVNCARWDSLFQLNLIISIEQEFQMSLSDNEAAGLTSFEAALQLIEEKQNALVDAE